jgi:hypothetical protein
MRWIVALLLLVLIFAFSYAQQGQNPGMGAGELAILPVFLGALAITLIIELAVSAAFVSLRKLDKNILVAVVVVNLVTMPLTWFFFPLLLAGVWAAIAAEAFAFAFEATFIYLSNKKMGAQNAVAISLLMNISSFILGGALFWEVMKAFRMS